MSFETMRTLLNDGVLKDSQSVLADIFSAIDLVLNEDCTWSKACRRQNLDAMQARNIVLNLAKARPDGDKMWTKEQFEEIMYDPYEKFYRDVFGEPNLAALPIPADYEDSVKYVLENTGLKEREVTVLTSRYGIDGENPMTLAEIGKILGVNSERIRQLESQTLRKCRLKHRLDVLRYGLEAVNRKKEEAEREAEQRKIYAREEANARLEVLKQEHEQEMDNIAACVIDKKALLEQPDKLFGVLAETGMEHLELSVRSYNALLRGGCRNVLDVSLKEDRQLKRIRNLGEKSVEEAKKRLDAFLKKEYELSAKDVRVIYATLGEKTK